MADLNQNTTLQPVTYQGVPRTQQQGLIPTAVDPAKLANLMQNAGVTTATFSLANNNTVTFTSTISSNISPNNRLGAVPVQVAFFLTSISLANLIPFGSNITPSQWTTYGPFVMPEFSPGGSSGNNLVTKAAITNATGSTQTVIFATDYRIIQAGKQGV